MLFSKKTPQKGKRKQQVNETSENWLVRSLFRPFTLLWLALITAIVVLVPRIYEKLPDITAQNRYQLTRANIYLQDRPDWVPAHFLNSVLAKQTIPESVLEPELAQTISTWFRNEPWVKKVNAVRISYPPAATVELTFREPVAVVELEGRLHPIDADAVILPREDFSPATLERFPILQPSKVPPPLYEGIVWDDDVIKKGAVLANQLKPYWKQFDFVAIRALPKTEAHSLSENQDYDPAFEILSASGSVIIWGRSPNSTHPGELAFDEKIRRLIAYQERFQGFAQPNGPYEIDITHWTDISRRVLTEAATHPERNHRR
ncbi:MAG: hypothetical protein KDA65_17375 [Planctomycetaceae bacterium]|nr:hypothetical protein [Planctomycetaceae bacterium]